MREHLPDETRIHYVITEGGKAPNVVPDYAEVYYYVRHSNGAKLEPVWQRVLAAAAGAAQGTGTSLEVEVMHGNHSVLPNTRLTTLMHKSLSQVGGVQYDEQELAFAEKIAATFDKNLLGQEARVMPMETRAGKGSTDVGDVSWVVPTVGLRTATWVPGTSAHSWQAIAAGGTSIGAKGMLVAAKTLSLTAMALFSDPDIIKAAKDEFAKRRGEDFQYKALLGDREPPLDYRL
ncbi:MAG: peptidase dimerization domain-containing protein, partial [Pseudomonadales bacterium]